MKRLVCDNCGASLQPEDGASVIICPYCGTSYDLSDGSSQKAPDIPTSVLQHKRKTSKSFKWLIAVLVFIPTLAALTPVLLLLPAFTHVIPELSKVFRHRPYRYCTVNADGDRIPDVLLYTYDKGVVLLNGRDGSVMATADSGADELPSVYLCLAHSMMAVQKDDGRYEIFGLQPNGEHTEILTTIIDPADSITSYAEGKGCVALKDKGGTQTNIVPPGRVVPECDTDGRFTPVYKNPTNVYILSQTKPTELKSDDGTTYRITANSSYMVFLEARTGSKKLYRRRLHYKTLFTSYVGALLWKGNPYLIVTEPKKSSGDITGDAVLLAIDGKTGKPMWKHVFDSGPSPSLALLEVHDGRLYAGFYGDGVTVLDLSSRGKVLWHY